MEIKINTTTKIITLLEPITIKELYKNLYELLGESFEEYKISIEPTICYYPAWQPQWQSPHYITDPTVTTSSEFASK